MLKKLPIVRHIRYFMTIRRINQHYAMWVQMGMLPVNADSDYEVADAIWRGDL